MKLFKLYVLAASLFAATFAYGAEPTSGDASQPTQLSGVLESLSVFKNGIVVVEERFDVPGSGCYMTYAPPAPLHGTFFVQSDAEVQTTSSTRNVPTPLADATGLDWTVDFQGRWLSVVLPGETETRTVRVVPTARNASDESSATPYVDPFSSRRSYASTGDSRSRGVLLECEDGETIWLADATSIAKVALAKDVAPTTVERKKNVLTFDVVVAPEKKTQGATIRLFYLTQGMCWAPQYRVALQDDKSLTLEQTAILLNDWRDFADAPVAICSGFPQIQLQNVVSPMGANVDMRSFLSYLGGSRNFNAQNVMTQQMVMNSNAVMPEVPALDLASTDEASFSEGVDVVSKDVGKRSLKKGDRVAFNVAKNVAAYRRFVCWNIFDARDASGRSNPNADQGTASYARTTNGSASGALGARFAEPWDVVAFNNPFDFSLTTGPATIVDADGRFLGQNALYWTNSKERAVLPITKALSVRVSSVENERKFDETKLASTQEMEILQAKLFPDLWGGTIKVRNAFFHVALVDAVITVANQRAEETTMQIGRQITGIELPDSFEGFDESPKSKLISDDSGGFYRTFNPKKELTWTTTLKPGEKKTFTFSYQVLIAQ